MTMWSIIWRLFVFLFLYVFALALVKEEVPSHPIAQIVVYSTISFLWIYITLVYFTNKFGSLVLVM